MQQGGVFWSHEDPITKSKRVTDTNGNLVSISELDPWGADTSRSSNSAFQPQNFTTYIRDGNGQQDAMARRYSVGGRFAQPDPYGGSYNFRDPQSLNRYAYTKNDPVNFRDPSGLTFAPLVPLPQTWTVTVTAPPPDPIPADVTGGFGNEGMMIVLASDQQQSEVLPADLKERVLDIAGSCSGFLREYFGALSKEGSLYNTDIETIYNRVSSMEISDVAFKNVKEGDSWHAEGLSDVRGSRRLVYVRNHPEYLGQPAKAEFRALSHRYRR